MKPNETGCYGSGTHECLTTCTGCDQASDIECMSFECDEPSKYIDSMLFDSGTVIARGHFRKGNTNIFVNLLVAGEVSVTFKGDVYHTPSEFPKELVERIKMHPNDWMYCAPSGEENDDEDGDVYVSLNNWFEYVYSADNTTAGDLVYEQDLAATKREELVTDMFEVAEYCYETLVKKVA